MLPFGSHEAKGSAGLWVMDIPQGSCPGRRATGHSSGVPSQSPTGDTPPVRQVGFGTSSCHSAWADAQVLVSVAMPWAGCHFGKGHFIALLLLLLAQLWLCSAYLQLPALRGRAGSQPCGSSLARCLRLATKSDAILSFPSLERFSIVKKPKNIHKLYPGTKMLESVSLQGETSASSSLS